MKEIGFFEYDEKVKKLLLVLAEILIFVAALFSLDLELSVHFESDQFQKLVSSGYLSDPVPSTVFSENPYFQFSPYTFWSADTILLDLDEDFILGGNQLAGSDFQCLRNVVERFKGLQNSRIGVIMHPSESEGITDESSGNFYSALGKLLRSLEAESLEIGGILHNSERLAQLKKEMFQVLPDIPVRSSLQESSGWIENDNYRTLHLYDYSGKHCTLQSAESVLFRLVKEKNADLSKSVLAIPTYGRKFRDDDPDYWFGVMDYRSIVREFSPSEESSTAGGYYFNSLALLESKVKMAERYGINTVRIAQIEQDSSGSYSLWRRLLDIRK